MKPFITIGITTYNRRKLLSHALNSVIQQTYTDFEVIIGNDYTEETLSSELFGINDSRIKFINHSENLKEIANMNLLLSKANGRYFTWLNDDDLYTPEFLECIYKSLKENRFPSCVYTSYKIIRGTTNTIKLRKKSYNIQLFSGSEFLGKYFKGAIKIMGVNGIFETAFLKRISGVKQLCDASIGLYSEYLLIVECGLLKDVIYINSPLVIYRNHDSNWTDNNLEIEHYKLAGKNLIIESFKLLKSNELSIDFHKNINTIIKIVFQKFVEKASLKPKYPSLRESILYYKSLNENLNIIMNKNFFSKKFITKWRAGFWFVIPFIEGKFKTFAPKSLLWLVYKFSYILKNNFYLFKK